MAVIRTSAAKTFGAENLIFVPTIANINAPTVAEITGASSLDLTGYFYDDTGRPSQSTNRVTRKRRVYDTVQYEQIGITQMTGGEFMYAIDPQAAAASNGKKAYEKLAPGTTGYLVRRAAVNADTAVAIGQFVSVFPIEVGPQLDVNAGEGETAEAGIAQAFAITGPAAILKAVA